MMLRTTQHWLLGSILGLVLGLPIGAAPGQEPPAKEPTESAKPDQPPSTQPSPPPDSQEGKAELEKLLKLRDQMQREQQEREKQGPATENGSPGRGTRPHVSRRLPPVRPGEPVRPADGAVPKGPDSMEELRARARASTQRTEPPRSQPTTDLSRVPPDFVGPPESLANVQPTPPEETGAEKPAETAESATPPVPSEPVPAEPRQARAHRPAPDEKSEWFSFDNMPWEDVIAHFVERIGKPLMDQGDIIIGGELTYKSDRKFTQQEAIDELNLILHEKGYRFVEEEHHVYVVPLSEMPQHVDLKLVFPTVAAFEEAHPRDMDYVAVYYQVKDRPAQVYVDMFGDALPDYSRLSALSESNQIKIVALARDVRKFLALKDMIDISPGDPRKLRFFDIKTNARDIERMVRDFLNLGGGEPRIQMVPDPRTGRMMPQVVGGGQESRNVQMVADDRTNSIIVKATEDQMKEIEELIAKFDQKPDIGEFKTEVIEIKHADATEVANLLNQILQQEQGEVRTPAWQIQRQIQQARLQAMRRGGRQPAVQVPPQQGVSPEDIMTEGIFERAKKTIRLVADARMNALIVYANDEGLARVRKMLEVLDKPQSDNLRTFALEHAKVADVTPLLTQLASGMTQAAMAGGRTGPNIVADEANNVIYVMAERDAMERISQLIEQLDVPGPQQERHVIELTNLRPSVVAQMVQALLSSGTSPGAGVSPRYPRGRVPGPAVSGTAPASYQVIPLDEAQVLIVICSAEDWEKVEQTIRMWDERAVSNTPRLETFPIQKGNPQSIATTLSAFYRTYEHPVLGRSPVVIQADGDNLLVYGVQPAIEEIGALIKALDVQRDVDKIEILPLVNADATLVAQQLQAMFMRNLRPGAPAPLIQPEPVTNSLVVQADKADLERIKDFAMRMDQAITQQATQQRFFTLRYAQPQEVAGAIQNVFGPASRPGRGVVAQVKAFASGAQVIVEAPQDKMSAIETFIAQLDDPKGKEMVVKPVKLAGSDVNQIAATLMQTIRTWPRRPDGAQPTLIPDLTTETIIVSAPADMVAQIENLISTFASGAEDLTLERHVYPITIADASYVADHLQRQLSWLVSQKKSQVVASRINISVDTRQNQVILNAPKFVHPMAEELVDILDREAKLIDVKSRTLRLVNADATMVVNTLRPMFLERARREQQNKSYVPVTLTPDTLTNAVLIYGGDEADQKVLDEEIARMDQDTAALDQPPVTIPLKYADPNQMAQTIQVMYRAAGGRSQQQDVQVTVSNGQLVIKAPRKKLDEIQDLVAAVDAEDAGGLQIKTYDLKVLSAPQLQAQVQLFLSQMRKNVKAGQLPPGAFAEPTTNTLVVLAPPEVMPMIDELILTLEGKAPKEGRARSFVLKNARAEQIAQNVDAMLKAKVMEREGARKGGVQTAVFADPASNRLFIYAPDDYQELAAKLIEMVDSEVETGEIVHIVTLENGEAQQLAQSLGQVISGRAGSGSPGARSGTATVRISADAGSNSILLAGMPKDVAEVEKWVGELESNSVRVPELQTFQLEYASTTEVEETLNKLFGGGRNAQDAVTITADEYSGRLIVTANRRKMRQVETYIKQLDQAPAEGEEGMFRGNQQLYFVDIARGSASDVAWDVRDLLPDKKHGGPSIEADWFDQYLIVKCRESEFPKIEKLIREFERRVKPELVIRTRKVRDPRVLQYLLARRDDVVIEQPPPEARRTTLIEDLWNEGEEPPWLKEKHERSGPRLVPFQTGLRLSAILLDEVDSRAASEQEPPPSGQLVPRPPESQPAEPASPGAGQTVTSPFEKEMTRIVVQPDGTILMKGPRKDVDDIGDILDLLEGDLAVGEVIRIFHFRYGDVNAAAEILNIMFNEARVIIPQAPQQPQRGQQPGRPGEEGRGEGREQQQPQPNIMEQLRGMVGGRLAGQGGRAGGGQRMRIATDPGHSYLIVKCDEADLPEIRDLLRELDIPPGEVQIKIFQLKNLSAQETAQNIKDVLGISKVQERRGAGRLPSPGRGGPGAQQQQLIEMLQQQLVSVPGVEGGAKVERVEIVPNALTNSLMVSAPPEVMTLIEKVIGQLEELEGFDVVGIYHYPLQNARVDDLVPLLQEIFGSAAGGAAGGGPRVRGAAAGGASPAALGPVSISADPRNNTIIFTAEAKDVETVRNQIRILDIAGPVAEAEIYVCRYGDAESIASAVEAIFLGGGGAGPRAPRGGATGPVVDVRITADAATNTILVWGPLDKRDLIFAKIEELDRLNQRDIREIAVKYADPERLAATLLQVFGAGGGAGPAGAGPGRRVRPTAAGPGASAAGHVMILGDKAAKKLLVRAPDEIYGQIQELVVTLDQPSQDMQLKRFQLKYADADGVVDSVKQAMTEYLQIAKATGTETDFDAFTAVPDPRTNSVVVVGSERTFLFVSNVLAAVDVPTPEDQKKEFRLFILDRANAATVADAINAFATGGAAAAGGRRGPGARGAAAGMPAGPRELNVFAVAEETTNSVMVFGRPEDIDLVEEMVIARLEDSISDHFRIETIAVKNVPPSQIVSLVTMFMGQGLAAEGAAPGRGRPATERPGPQIVPNDNAKTLVVRGTRRQVEEVRELVQRFDDKDIVQQTIRVIEIPYGQDAVRLAGEVERIVNQSEAEIAAQSGRRAKQVTIGADEYTNTIIVAGDPTLFGQAEMIVKQLAEARTPQPVTRVIQLKNLSPQDAEQLINNLQQRRAGSSGRTGGAIRTSGTRSTPSASPPSSGGQRQPSAPRPSGGGRRPSGGGGGALLDQPGMPGAMATHRVAMPRRWVSWVEPSLALTPLTPTLALMLVDPPPGQPDSPPRPPTTRAFGPAAMERLTELVDEEAPETQPAAAGPPETAEALTGVSGALRGEVTAAAIDSQRIVITGDEKDVEFIEQILAMMEQSATAALVEVFALENAKATALAPIIDKAIKAQIDARTRTPGPQDRFSINAEARSNSLIVSASQAIMERIAELVQRLDVVKPDGTDFKTVPLLFVRASNAVAMLRPAIEKLNKMREVPAESQASIEAVDQINSVLIIGTPRDIEEIGRLVKTVDVELSADQKQASFLVADVVLIQLQNGVAEDVAKVLTDMIEKEQDLAIQAGGDKKAGKPFVKKLRLRLADGRELPELDLERPIKVLPEKGTNSLIIFSTKENNQALAAIVEVFDTLPVGADTDVKAFALRHAGAEAVAKLLTDTFKEKGYLARPGEGESKGLEKGRLPPIPPGVAAKGLPYQVVVQHDVRSNTVIVIGREDAVLLAGGLITELDRPSMELGLKAYTLQLKSAQATQLADKLKKLLDDRAKALGADKNAARDNAVIQPDERSNALIVLATEEVYGMVEDLVLELDAAEKYSVVDLRYQPLRYADAVKLQGLLEETFKSRQDAESKLNKESKDTLSVLADARSNSLLLTGTRDYLTEAERLIGELDRPSDGTVEFRARKVRLNSARNIASLLQEMIDKALKQQDSKLKGTPIHVAADPVSDTLLIAASREDLAVLERWVEILDRPSEVGRMTRVIPLHRAAAEELSKSVQDIFKKQAGAKGGGEIDVTITADKTTNSVVAFGPPALLADVEDFVRQLDGTEPAKGTVVRIFQLQQAAAQDAGDLLLRILELRGGSVGGTGGGGGGGGASQQADEQVLLIFQRQHPELGVETLKAMRKDVTVISDVRTNSLVVTAPAESMPLMESLVAAVDVPPQDAKIRVFRLRNADAEQMVKTLEALFERRTAAGGTRAGAGQEPERVLTLGEGLGAGGRQEVAFTTDLRTNSVIAAGTPGYLDLVEQMILELDTIPINERETFVYAPLNIKADQLVPSIKEFSDAVQKQLQDIGKDVSVAVKQERQITAIANKDANRIILDVDPRFKDAVMSVVRELDQPPPQVMIQVLIVEVTMDNELDLGVEFAFQDLQYAKAGATDTTTFDFVGGTDIGAAGSGLGGFTFTITGADFNFLFRTLQNEGSLNVLSRPQIVAMDNQEAYIDISNDVPYVTGTSTTTGGQITTSVARERIGIKLQVTPQINPDGFVRMEIQQEVSDFAGSTVDVGQGVTAPVFFRREAKTTVTVKDNETVVLGGLITSRMENREQKVPLVGDIPGLGLLFRNQTDSSKRTELLVVLTPHVVRTVDDYRALSVAERDRMEVIPTDVLSDPLMQGLRVNPEELREIESEQGGPAIIGRETPAQRDENTREQYGPLRPARQPESAPSEPDSYDVPLTYRTRRS